MENLIISKGLIHADSTLNFEGELEGIDPARYKNLEVFKGNAASLDTTMNYFRHSDRALQQLADAYTAGKGMYTDHNIKYPNRIGVTLKGSVVDGMLEVVFGLRPNLEVSNSNDIIALVRDTGADLSASYYPDQITCGIEGCGADVHAYGFWFFNWYECENGHEVGSIHKDDDGKEERVVGVIESIEDTAELTICTVGANTTSEVLGEVTDAMQAEIASQVGNDMAYLRFLSDINGLDFENARLSFGIQDTKPNRSVSLPPRRDALHNKGGSTVPQGDANAIIKDFSNIDWSAIEDSDSDDLLEIIREFASHVDAQNSEISEMKSAEEYETLSTEFTELQNELEQVNQELEDARAKLAIYDAELEYWQDACIEKKQKLRSYGDNDPRLLAYAEDIRKETNIQKLRNKTTGHSDTIQAVGNVEKYMELKPAPETVEVKSNY